MKQNKIKQETKIVHFAKGTEANSSKTDIANEIKDISNSETEDKDTPIHTDLSDLNIITDDFDL